MKLRDLYAQQLGFIDVAAMKKNYDHRPETQAAAIEGLIISHVIKALDAIEKSTTHQKRDL